MVRDIDVSEVESAVQAALAEAVYHLPEDYVAMLTEAYSGEDLNIGQASLQILLENAHYAQAEGIPTCQDTGMVILDLAIGQDIHFTGGDLNRALDRAVRQAYTTLRKSVVNDPLLRANTGDNTPPIIHYEIIPGDKLQITLLMKGFGAELMSELRMFPPSVGVEGVKRFVLETVEHAGPSACPPVIVGVGIGSSFDGVAYLAKKALMRPLGCPNLQPHLAKLEHELLEEDQPIGHWSSGFWRSFHSPWGKYRKLSNTYRGVAGGSESQLFGPATSNSCHLNVSLFIMDGIRIQAPFDDPTVALLHAGDVVLISGVLLGARDAAHARLIASLSRGESLPVQLKDQVIYYVGPAPAKPGFVIGPAGPTTSGRMDPYTIPLIEQGVKGFVGKGSRSPEVKAALVKHRAVYLATIGGAAALLARQIQASRIVAYPELGTEAIHELHVTDFPAIVINDIYGADAYTRGRKLYLSGKFN